MQMHSSPGVPRFLELLRMPTKNPEGAYTLAYVLENVDLLKNEYVDVVVAVTFVRIFRFNIYFIYYLWYII